MFKWQQFGRKLSWSDVLASGGMVASILNFDTKMQVGGQTLNCFMYGKAPLSTGSEITWPFNMGPIGYPETAGRNHKSIPCKIPKERNITAKVWYHVFPFNFQFPLISLRSSNNCRRVDMDMSYTRVLHIKVAYRVHHKWRHAFYVTRPLLCARLTCYVTVITHGRCHARA
jgi:hypothetical protein